MQDQLIRVIICNIDMLEDEHFKAIPWRIAKKIWERIRRDKFATLKIWDQFRNAYAAEDKELRHYSLSISNANHLGSRAFSEIRTGAMTMVSISDARLSLSDLLDIAYLPNLTVLILRGVYYMPSSSGEGDLDEGIYPLDKRMFYKWSTTVQHGGFSKLRTIVFQDDSGIPVLFLEHLCEFPNLNLVIQLANSTGSKASFTMPEHISRAGWRPLLHPEDTAKIVEKAKRQRNISIDSTFHQLLELSEHFSSKAEFSKVTTLSIRIGSVPLETENWNELVGFWYQRGNPQMHARIEKQRREESCKTAPKPKKRKIQDVGQLLHILTKE
jgi:hypothetical protein